MAGGDSDGGHSGTKKYIAPNRPAAGFSAAGGEYGQYSQLAVITMAAPAARFLKKHLLLLFTGIYSLGLVLLVLPGTGSRGLP